VVLTKLDVVRFMLFGKFVQLVLLLNKGGLLLFIYIIDFVDIFITLFFFLVLVRHLRNLHIFPTQIIKNIFCLQSAFWIFYKHLPNELPQIFLFNLIQHLF
jgi:hypothetical protein